MGLGRESSRWQLPTSTQCGSPQERKWLIPETASFLNNPGTERSFQKGPGRRRGKSVIDLWGCLLQGLEGPRGVAQSLEGGGIGILNQSSNSSSLTA